MIMYHFFYNSEWHHNIQQYLQYKSHCQELEVEIMSDFQYTFLNSISCLKMMSKDC